MTSVRIKNNLEWLQDWYKKCCVLKNNETDFIKIETVDNPGWYVTINLSETKYKDFSFDKIKFDEDELNWYFCLKRNNNFEASCSPANLEIILENFRNWIDSFP